MRLCAAFAALLEGNFEAFIHNLTDAPPSLDGGRYAPGPMSLSAYLRGQPFGLPVWHQQLLLRHRLITVSRRLPDRRWTTLRETLTTEFQLNTPAGNVDVVSVTQDDPACRQELAALAAGAKDYAFVAEHDLDEGVIVNEERILNAVGTVVFGQSSLTESATTSLEDFVERLMSSERVTGPARQIRLVSHAHWLGALEMRSNAVLSGRKLTYESLVTNEHYPHRPLSIPDACLDPRGPAGDAPVVVVTGCEIGAARPLLEKLRRVLNPRFRLFAPKYWFAVGLTPEGEAFEYMGQPFIVSSKTALTRAQLIAELKRLPNPREVGIGGRRIQPGDWEGWVPQGPFENTLFFFKVRDIDVRLPGFMTSLGAVSARPLSLPTAALWKSPIHPDMNKLDVTVPTPLTELEVLADPIPALRSAVKGIPADPSNFLSAAHEFPLWVRYRFPAGGNSAAAVNAAIDAWIDSLEWRITTSVDDFGQTQLRAVGTGFKYALTIPIAEPGAGPISSRDLVVSYYVGSQATPVLDKMKITNSDFWLELS